MLALPFQAAESDTSGCSSALIKQAVQEHEFKDRFVPSLATDRSLIRTSGGVSDCRSGSHIGNST